MFPSIRQFRSWSYPEKFGFVSFFVGLLVTIVLWLFPETGKQLIQLFGSDTQPTVAVPGRSIIEQQLNRAKMEGVAATEPSTEFALAIAFARPSLTHDSMPEGFEGNNFALSNASPLRSQNQDLIFAPGKCRFSGTVKWQERPLLLGQGSISVMSCVLDNGDYYEIGRSDGPEIGFITPSNSPTSKEISLVEEDKVITLPKEAKYLVRFHSPLRDLKLKGKSSVSW